DNPRHGHPPTHSSFPTRRSSDLHFFLINKLLLILFKERIIYNGGDDDIDYLHNTGKPRPACSNKSAEKDRYSKRWLYDDRRENTCCKQNIVNCDNNSWT